MATTGTATINFGASPGGNAAQVDVTGQASITTAAYAEAFVMAETSADHNAEEHELVEGYLGLSCGNIVNGTGFTIYGRSDLQLTGQWTVRWVWA